MELTKESKAYLKSIVDGFKRVISVFSFENEDFRLYRINPESQLKKEIEEISYSYWIAAILGMDLDGTSASTLIEAIIELEDTGLKEEDLVSRVEDIEVFHSPLFGGGYYVHYCRIQDLYFMHFHDFDQILYDLILIEKKVESPDYTQVLFQMFSHIFKSTSNEKEKIMKFNEIHLNSKFINKELFQQKYPFYPKEYIRG